MKKIPEMLSELNKKLADLSIFHWKNRELFTQIIEKYPDWQSNYDKYLKVLRDALAESAMMANTDLWKD